MALSERACQTLMPHGWWYPAARKLPSAFPATNSCLPLTVTMGDPNGLNCLLSSSQAEGTGLKFRTPDIGRSRGERFLALDGQADTQPTSGVANPFRIQFST